MGKTSRIKQYRYSVVKDFLHCKVWFWFSWNQLCISCFSVESTNQPTHRRSLPTSQSCGKKTSGKFGRFGDKQEEGNLPKFSNWNSSSENIAAVASRDGGKTSAFCISWLHVEHCKMMAIAEENRFAYKWYSITCQCIIFGRFAGVAAVVGINKGSSNHGDW